MHPLDNKWYDRKYLVAILILFCPPVGLYALWKSKVFSDLVQIGITSAVVILILVIFTTLNKEDPTLALMEKRIKQNIFVSSLGTIKKIKIDSIAKIEERMCYIRYSFYNEMIKQDIRVSKKYIFLPDFSKIVKEEELITEIKAEGEWVSIGF